MKDLLLWFQGVNHDQSDDGYCPYWCLIGTDREKKYHDNEINHSLIGFPNNIF